MASSVGEPNTTCGCGHDQLQHHSAHLECLAHQCACKSYNPFEKGRQQEAIKKKLVELHGLLGEYELYVRGHGAIPHPKGGQTEIESIYQIQEAIEERTRKL